MFPLYPILSRSLPARPQRRRKERWLWWLFPSLSPLCEARDGGGTGGDTLPTAVPRPQAAPAAPHAAGSIPGVVSNKPVPKAFSAPFLSGYLVNCSLNKSVRAPSAAVRVWARERSGREHGSKSGQRLEGPRAEAAQLCGSRCLLLLPSDTRAVGMRRFCPGARWFDVP